MESKIDNNAVIEWITNMPANIMLEELILIQRACFKKAAFLQANVDSSDVSKPAFTTGQAR
jgi:hypothetical protein